MATFERNDEMNQPGLGTIWSEIGTQLQLLAIAGVAGAMFRAAFAPEQEWKRRVVQGVFGAVSAVFLGGLLAGVIDNFVDAGPYAYLGSGFIMGSGGEMAVRALQNRIFRR